MSQVLNPIHMLRLEYDKIVEQAINTAPCDLTFEEHLNRAKNNNVVMQMLITKESTFVQPEGKVGRLRAKMMKKREDRYIGGLHYGLWFIDTSNAQQPVAIKFTHEIQDALRPEAREIAIQNIRKSEREKELSSLFSR